jgi:hypothetical protein
VVEWYWVGDVLYLEFTPVSVEYDVWFDAFTLARAEIHLPNRHERRHTLAVTIVITSRSLHEQKISLDTAIREARALLPRLVSEHEAGARTLTADQSCIYDLDGRRLH